MEFIMVCTDLPATGQNSEKQGFGYPVFQKNSTHTHQIRIKLSPVSERLAYPPAKLRTLFPAHLWVREFCPQIYSLWQALDWGLLSKILVSMKMGGA